jgi:transcriptional regulator with XRE-family HTH domain
MLSKKELLSTPNYLLTKYQNEIFRQLVHYMESNNLSQKDIADKLGVSGSYISQVLNGNFNFTLKKLIELGLMMGKIPNLEFVTIDEFWFNEKEAQSKSPTISININLDICVFPIQKVQVVSIPQTGNFYTQKLISEPQEIPLNEFECCSN